MRPLSHSQITLYLQCPLKYKLKYVEKLKEKPKSYLSFGKSVHTALEYLFASRLQTPPSLDEVLGEAVKTDSPRKTTGEVFAEVEPASPPPPLPDETGAVQRIRTYYDKVKELKDKADSLKDYLGNNDPAKTTGSEKDYRDSQTR